MALKHPRFIATTIVAVVSLAAAPFIRGHEDTKLESYPDSGGVWTVCSGVTFIPGAGPITKNMKFTKDQCDDLDKAVREGFTLEVAKLLQRPISVETMIAHVTFAYNIGMHPKRGYPISRALRDYNAGNYESACNSMMNWYRAGGVDCRPRRSGCYGLIVRRKSEVAQCLEGLK